MKKCNWFIPLLFLITTLVRAETPAKPDLYDARLLRAFCDVVEASLTQVTREYDKEGRAVTTGKCNDAVFAQYSQGFAGLGIAADGTFSAHSVYDKSAMMVVSTLMKVITEKREDFESFRYFNGLASRMKEAFVNDHIGKPLLALISAMAGNDPSELSALSRPIAELIPETRLDQLDEVANQIVKRLALSP